MKRPSKNPRDIATALAALQWRVVNGQEFPDACFSVASRYFVDYTALADAYDEDDRQRAELKFSNAKELAP